jgi:hypothetical protein
MMIHTMAQQGEHPVAVDYEVPPPSRAVERHGPYVVVPRDVGGGVRINGVYRTVWGRWRRALRVTAGLGMALLLLGTIVDTMLQRTVVIDLTRSPPVFSGSAASLVGIALLCLALLAWLAFRALTWRRMHRLEIDAGPDELIVRQVLPSGEQISGRWKPGEVERIVAEQWELTVQPRDGASLKVIVGGAWTASFWLVDRLGEATGIATASVGRESTD